MADTKRKYFFLLIAGFVLVIIVFVFFVNRYSVKKESSSDNILLSPSKDTIPMPVAIQWLPDSSLIFLQKEAKVVPAENFNTNRSVKVDGEVFFETRDAAIPFVINTKLLILSISGKASFRIIAYDKEEWAEVQVISGTIGVKKAYPSQFSEPDTLRDNNLLMINRTIDLMEKEKLDTSDIRILQAWRQKIHF